MNQLILNEDIKKLLSRRGIENLFKMQIEIANKILLQNSFAFQSPTGSGKTLAYLLPIFQCLKDNANKVLIIAPNGEILAQISQLVDYLKPANISSISLSESGNMARQKEKLKKKKTHLIMATLKRILEFRNMKVIDLSSFNYLIIDEADIFFTKANIDNIAKLINFISPSYQLILSSATLDSSLFKKISYLENLELFDYGSLSKNIQHYRYKASADKQEISLVKLIKQAHITKALIFVNSASHTSHLKEFLNKNRLVTEEFSSFRDKLDRKKILNSFNHKKIRFIITTDSLARGIDVIDADVINYAPARDEKNYIHRSGRTARANKFGSCYNMTTSKNYFVIEKIAKKLKLNLIDL